MDSHSETEQGTALARHLQMGSFFKAFLISILIELAVLFLTLGSLGNSMMRHSTQAPHSIAEDMLSGFAIIFHFPSLLIVSPFGLFLFAPVVQIALMTGVIGLILRARLNRRKPSRPFLI
jgi:branched-subunit amino acid permease